MCYLQKIEELMTQTFLFEECGLFRPWSFCARPLTRLQLHVHVLQTRRAGPSNAAAQVGKATRQVERLCVTEAGLPHAVTASMSRMRHDICERATASRAWQEPHTQTQQNKYTVASSAAAHVYPMISDAEQEFHTMNPRCQSHVHAPQKMRSGCWQPAAAVETQHPWLNRSYSKTRLSSICKVHITK